MKARTAILLSLSLAVLYLSQAQAQQHMHGHGMGGRSPFWLPKDLNLTSKQTEQIKSIQRRYLEDIRGLRNDLLNKRYSLDLLLSDPTAKSAEIRAKQREVSALQNQIEEKLLDYQLKMREVLTPEQYRLWASRSRMPPGRGMHQGQGMGMTFR
jgi:Spy/CpxP family protein refolding chaperone